MSKQRPIRASEVGTYLFCKRAWWYGRKGVRSDNQLQMHNGQDLHHQHGIQVLLVGILRAAGAVLFLVSIALLTYYLTRIFL